jgi:hypothetical protein
MNSKPVSHVRLLLLLACWVCSPSVISAALKTITLPDNSTYRGETANGVFYGKGTLSWTNGSKYTGEFKHGLMDGKGEFIHANGDRYTGTLKKGQMDGEGILISASGGHYEGQFKNGHFHGHGTYTNSRGEKYVGEFRLDDFNGRGVYSYTNGDRYEGVFKDGAPNGPGIIYYKDSGTYIGEIKDWEMHGKGIYTQNSGYKYAGEFKKGELIKATRITYTSGDTYKGEVSNWTAHGQGTHTMANGNQYTGTFVQGSYNGQGILTYKNGDVYSGAFKNNLRHGKGALTLKNPRGYKKITVGYWQYDNYKGEKKPEEMKAKAKPPVFVNAEELLFKQKDKLDTLLSHFKPSTPGKPDLYMVSFGAYAGQDVFMREARFSKDYFDKHLGTLGRSVSLINNTKVMKDVPLADTTNLEYTLDRLSEVMEPEEDILFLFLTSHGSDKHELTVSFQNMPLSDLPAQKLANLLKQSKIKHKVIVVSACYSGGFIKALKDDYTMVLTSAKSDHVSFGCSDEAEFTYFGRAFFKDALPQSTSFKTAFAKANELVAEWENRERYTHSKPQIWTTPKIEKQLAKWRKTLPRRLAQHD